MMQQDQNGEEFNYLPENEADSLIMDSRVVKTVRNLKRMR